MTTSYSSSSGMNELFDTSSLAIPVPLADILRPHQISALHFLWRKLIDGGIAPNLRTSPSSPLEERVKLQYEVFGCIMGHSMGLGKTVTALSFLFLFQRYALSLSGGIYTMAKDGLDDACISGTVPAIRAIVLAPRSCTFQWQNTVEEWARPSLFDGVSLPIYIPQGTSSTATAMETLLRTFHSKGGILVLGYEAYQRLLRRAKADLAARSPPLCPRVGSLLDRIRLPLPLSDSVSMLDVLEEVDIVVLDEAHRLKRVASRLVSDLTTHLSRVQLRLALTGTPLQNHLEEYNVMHAVVTGAAPDPLLFRRLFVHPIERGQCVDSTPTQFREMQQCVASLRRFFGATVHHCGPEILERDLPERREFVIFVGLSQKQEEVYRAMLQRQKMRRQKQQHQKQQQRRRQTSEDGPGLVLSLHHEASHICLHPDLSLAKARFLGAHAAPVSGEGGGNGVLRLNDGCGTNQGVSKSTSRPLYLENDTSSMDAESDISDGESSEGGEGFEEAKEDAEKLLNGMKLTDSPKLLLVFFLVRCIATKLEEKVVIFSTYRSHLFLIQRLLRHVGLNCDILHGGLDVRERQRIVEQFTKDPERRVLLGSTRAGGVGINLAVANHCILLDVSWNPADDTQATYRIYRYGQKKPVTVYRVATEGTFEHVVFFYALSKSWLHKKIADVVDPTRYERHLRDNYFMYPCMLPTLGPSEGEEQANRSSWLNYAKEHCPALALTAGDGALDNIRSIIAQSFLLRDDAAEAVAAMEKRFENEKRHLEQRRRSRLPVLMDMSRTHLTAAEKSKGEDDDLGSCEPALRALLANGAQYLDELSPEVSLCQILAMATGVREPVEGLIALLVRFYRRGLTQLLRDTINRQAYAQIRAFLSSRVAAGEILESVLRNRPFALLAKLEPVEVTYLLTEMGLMRPLVPHCTILGANLLLCESKIPTKILDELYHAIETSPLMQNGISFNKDSNDVVLSQGDLSDTVVGRLAGAVTGSLASYWPLLIGLALPSQPHDLTAKQQLANRAFVSATELSSGFISMREAAVLIGLDSVPGRRDQYFCRRCQAGLLARVPPDVSFRCSHCHYNAEFDAQTHNESRHAVLLYQLATVCSLLGRFSVGRSLTTSFDPENCRSALQMLRHLHHATKSTASQTFISDAMTRGIEAFLSGIPPVTATLAALQSGAGSDMVRFSELLAVDSNRIWRIAIRPHIKAALTAWLQPACGTTALPDAFIALSIRSAVRAFDDGIYARDVLLAAAKTVSPTLLSSSSLPSSMEGTISMLRFACDGLVTLKYTERLLRFHMDGTIPSTVMPVRALDVSSDSDAASDNSIGSTPSVVRRVKPQKRQRDFSPDSMNSIVNSGASSFSSCYSDDLGVGNKDMAGDNESLDASDDHQGRIATEDILHTRLTCYWAAYCEVYGTRGVESLNVMVEDEEQGMLILPPPPNSFWVSEVKLATREGMRLDVVADEFLARITTLASSVRVIK